MHDRRRLRDIVSCATEIAEYTATIDIDDLLEDRLRQRAIERLLTIIGEAAKHLDASTRDAIDQPWREFIRFRDKGIHAYDSLSPRTVYRIATESVPELRAAIDAFLSRPE